MKCYKVQMMTKGDFFEYMRGGYNYAVKVHEVVAKDEQTAVKKANFLYPDMVVNSAYVQECQIPEGYCDQITLADL